MPDSRPRLKLNKEKGGGVEIGNKGTRTIPIRRHRGGVARDRHVPPTKIVSQRSSSQNPPSSSIYATLKRQNRNVEIENKGTRTILIRRHCRGVAHNRHTLLTKVVSRSSSSQNPPSSPIYATLKRQNSKIPFQEAHETTCHRLSGFRPIYTIVPWVLIELTQIKARGISFGVGNGFCITWVFFKETEDGGGGCLSHGVKTKKGAWYLILWAWRRGAGRE
ncbi:hypothetical protein Cgig2_010814 [Carnegiea gigantea]|uniref:Uncharacterized protein n=1 Tax=Carnegiea gigantea TaxID=171969 RepID=A0A9Q1JPY8_9CARY|nr:hypothetical protein Cgig2_010814 [Carnegiea gigantea]